MDIFSFITSAEYRRHWRRTYAEGLVRERHELVNKHVFVQEIFYFTKDSWNKKFYISFDGVPICDYTDSHADRKYLETLQHRYYVRNRHTILCR